MNERITRLAKQVDACYIPRYDIWQMDTESLEKFATLMIEECIKHVRDRAMRAGGGCTIVGEEGLWLAKDMEKHFGVDKWSNKFEI